MTEDKMIGRHHQLDGHESEQAQGVMMDREAWHATVHGVAKSCLRQTIVINFTFNLEHKGLRKEIFFF